MNYSIVEVIQDMGGQHMARVIIDETTKETIFFKFDHYPTQEQVNSIADQYNSQKNTIPVEGV